MFHIILVVPGEMRLYCKYASRAERFPHQVHAAPFAASACMSTCETRMLWVAANTFVIDSHCNIQGLGRQVTHLGCPHMLDCLKGS